MKSIKLLTNSIGYMMVFLLMSSPSIVMASGTQMTGEQLHQLLDSGKRLVLGGDGEGYKGELLLKADGTGKGGAVTDSGKKISLEGTWEIVGDEFCRVWKNFKEGNRVCERWMLIGENEVEVQALDMKTKKHKKIGVNSW